MLKAACHCTAVRLEIAAAPDWVVDCNCTLCRRYGALWAYYKTGEVTLVQGETDTYLWADRMLAFHRCKACGCVTHHTALDTDPPRIRAVNVRMRSIPPACSSNTQTTATPAISGQGRQTNSSRADILR